MSNAELSPVLQLLCAQLKDDLQASLALIDKIVQGIDALDPPSFSSAPAPAITVPYRSQWDSDAQRVKNDCGPACVAMILNARGVHDISVDALTEACGLGVTKTLTAGGDLAFLAALRGVQLEIVSGMNVSYFVKRAPCIVLIHYGSIPGNMDTYQSGHWCVVTGGTESEVFFHDPNWWGARRDEGAFRRVPLAVFDQALADCVQDGNPPGYGLVLK